MTDDIRSQLARRLFDVVWEARHRPLPPDMLYSVAQKTEYADLADEALRLMEWAQRQAMEAAYTHVIGSDFATIHPPPLTLPPDDWKP